MGRPVGQIQSMELCHLTYRTACEARNSVVGGTVAGVAPGAAAINSSATKFQPEGQMTQLHAPDLACELALHTGSNLQGQMSWPPLMKRNIWGNIVPFVPHTMLTNGCV